MMWDCEDEQDWAKLQELLNIYDGLNTTEFIDDVKKSKKVLRNSKRRSNSMSICFVNFDDKKTAQSICNDMSLSFLLNKHRDFGKLTGNLRVYIIFAKYFFLEVMQWQ